MADPAISDERIAQVLGVYARMANRVIGDPVRWLGLDDDPPPTAALPAQGARRGPRPRLRRGDARASPTWGAASAAERVRWWVRRIGVSAGLAAAVPRVAGALASRFPLQAALGASAAGLAVCATAREHGVVEPERWVPLLAKVLLDRDVTPRPVADGGRGRGRRAGSTRTPPRRRRGASGPARVAPPARSGTWPVRSGSCSRCSTSARAATSSSARSPRCPSSAWPAASWTSAAASSERPRRRPRCSRRPALSRVRAGPARRLGPRQAQRSGRAASAARSPAAARGTAARSSSPASPASDAQSSGPDPARGSSLLRGRPSRASGGDVAGRAHRRALGQVGPLPGDADGVAQAAELVDQPDLAGVGPGPDPAAGDAARPRRGSGPRPCGDAAGEVLVDGVEEDVEAFALLVGERAARGEHPGALALLDHARRRGRAARAARSTTNLPPKTPIEPVSVAGSATITSAGQAT